jgi:hypothetical protein
VPETAGRSVTVTVTSAFHPACCIPTLPQSLCLAWNRLAENPVPQRAILGLQNPKILNPDPPTPPPAQSLCLAWNALDGGAAELAWGLLASARRRTSCDDGVNSTPSPHKCGSGGPVALARLDLTGTNLDGRDQMALAALLAFGSHLPLATLDISHNDLFATGSAVAAQCLLRQASAPLARAYIWACVRACVKIRTCTRFMDFTPAVHAYTCPTCAQVHARQAPPQEGQHSDSDDVSAAMRLPSRGGAAAAAVGVAAWRRAGAAVSAYIAAGGNASSSAPAPADTRGGSSSDSDGSASGTPRPAPPRAARRPHPRPIEVLTEGCRLVDSGDDGRSDNGRPPRGTQAFDLQLGDTGRERFVARLLVEHEAAARSHHRVVWTSVRLNDTVFRSTRGVEPIPFDVVYAGWLADAGLPEAGRLSLTVEPLQAGECEWVEQAQR